MTSVSGMLATFYSRIRRLLRLFLLKILFALSARKEVDGIEVLDVAEEDSRHAIERLGAALDTIARIDPRRYARLKRDLPRIALVKRGQPQFAPEVGACLLRSGYVREAEVAFVATTLVHEATHARLCRRGDRDDPAQVGRIEEICINQQIAFSERLGRPDITAHLREKMALRWWMGTDKAGRA